MEARARGTIEPLALSAAIVAAVMAVVYVWLIHQQGNQPLPWVLIALVAGALLAAYGALWRVPYRRTALVLAVIVLAVLGVLGILSIGLPILASGVLALVSLLRPPRHEPTVLQTAMAQVGLFTMTCGDARRVNRRLRCIPRMSHAPAIRGRTRTISLGIGAIRPDVRSDLRSSMSARDREMLPFTEAIGTLMARRLGQPGALAHFADYRSAGVRVRVAAASRSGHQAATLADVALAVLVVLVLVRRPTPVRTSSDRACPVVIA